MSVITKPAVSVRGLEEVPFLDVYANRVEDYGDEPVRVEVSWWRGGKTTATIVGDAATVRVIVRRLAGTPLCIRAGYIEADYRNDCDCCPSSPNYRNSSDE